MMLSSILALIALTLIGKCFCFPGCTDSTSQIYVFNRNDKSMSVKDNRCAAKVIPGAWCDWEPVETGHGVTRCQKGLNIRWRRRVCACPFPHPVHDPVTWCRPMKNATSIAQLKSGTYTRLEALKIEVWADETKWVKKMPFARVSRVANSLLGCLELEDCYFHTGTTYTGKQDQPNNDFTCQPWSNYRKQMQFDGMTRDEVSRFLLTEPKNYCRNPYSTHATASDARIKPWCFIGTVDYKMGSEPLLEWRYCNISACSSVQFRGSIAFDTKKDPFDQLVHSQSTDLNAESCFATCRYSCQKYAIMNVRKRNNDALKCCQCYGNEEKGDAMADADAYFLNRSMDHVKVPNIVSQEDNIRLRGMHYNELNGYHKQYGPFSELIWDNCYLYSSSFRCPQMPAEQRAELRSTSEPFPILLGSVFELALPRSCYETNHLVEDFPSKTKFDSMTIFGSMGDFREFHTFSASVKDKTILMSSLNPSLTLISSMCSHMTASHPMCPPFTSESRHDIDSYFNRVVDADYHWAILDLRSHVPVGIIKLVGLLATDDNDLLQYDVFVRSKPLPSWLRTMDYDWTSGTSRGTTKRTEYFRKATMSEQRLWWKCEDVKRLGTKTDEFYSECSPHQRVRWVMLRLNANTDLLEMKKCLGIDWVYPNEIAQLQFKSLTVYTLPRHNFNCITMHHPPMGPDYADFWEDLYSFDSEGQPMDPPVNTPVHPQFTLPLKTHDSVHPEDKFVQEDWDVEACGDWELLDNTTVIGVPEKLKLTFTITSPRGRNCYQRTEDIFPVKDTACKRSIYFRVDSDGGEVVHYPEFGRSYNLAGNLKNCQFVCAIARECKAFEFSMNKFCRLHLISYQLDTMFVYADNVVYGRKSDVMFTTNPFTWNNPFHPYYRLLQDLLSESGFVQ